MLPLLVGYPFHLVCSFWRDVYGVSRELGQPGSTKSILMVNKVTDMSARLLTHPWTESFFFF